MGLAERPSARRDALVSVAPLIERVGRATDLIGIEPDAAALLRLRAAESTGRPLGGDDFILALEARLGRSLRPRKPGRKPRPTSLDVQRNENWRNASGVIVMA